MTWLRDHRTLVIFSVLVAAQLAFVLGVIVREEQRLGGLEIVLESRPVDPRDPLRGDYVILSYVAEDVSNVNRFTSRTTGTVYVQFEDRGRYWQPVGVWDTLPDRDEWGRDEAFVRATVTSTDPLQVSYEDLGVYFVPQGTGNLPEPPDVVVSVSADGTTRIKRLEIDGLRWPDDADEVSQDQPAPGPIGAATPRATTEPAAPATSTTR